MRAAYFKESLLQRITFMRNLMLAALCSLLLAFAGLAQSQPALTGDTIDRWIATVQEMQLWSDEYDDEDNWELMDDGMDEDMDLERIYQRLADSEAQVRSVIERNGFRDGDEWANIGSRISQAFMVLEMGDAQSEFQQAMREARREIEQAEHLTDEQRAMMLEQMEQSQRMLDAQMGEVSEDDLAAVRSRRGELRELFEYDDD